MASKKKTGISAAIERAFLKVSPGAKYRGFRVASWLSGKVPLKLSYGLAAIIGDYIYYTWHDHSSHAISNMRRVLGRNATLWQARRMARQSFRNYAKTLVDFIRFPHVSRKEIVSRVEVIGWDVLDQARAEGKGVLAVSAHIGNWDFASALLGMHELTLHAVADTLEPPQLDELVKSTRLRNGVNILPLGAPALRSMFQALKRNELVLLLMDRPMGPDDGIPVTFFGERAYLPSGPAAIALKSGASLVTGALVRTAGDKKFSGAWEPIPYRHLLSGDKDADIQAITQQIAGALEHVISRTPDQWYMFRPMWPRLDVSRRLARQEAAELRALQQLQLATNGKAEDGRGLGRLRARLGRRAARGPIDIAALGISVDPPEMESWARGHYNPAGSEMDPALEAEPQSQAPAHALAQNGHAAAASAAETSPLDEAARRRQIAK